jgi:hypothetical protein
MHAGAEGTAAAHVNRQMETFLGEARGDVWAFAHAVVDAGADLVLGHGPHRLRAAEIYRGRLIAYSLGNFCSWETFSLEGALGITALLGVELAANGVALRAELLSAKIIKPGRAHPDPAGEGLKIVRDLSSKDFDDPIFDEQGRWLRRVAETRSASAKTSATGPVASPVASSAASAEPGSATVDER